MEPSCEHDSDVQRKRDRRSKAAEVYIPPVADVKRRAACLADPELFLKTYFKQIFFSPFVIHHRRMIAAIHERALSGGDKAIAAPRGDGKTQIAICMLVFILLATDIRFPVIVGATTKKGRKLFNQVKRKFASPRKYPDFVADFPEVTAPVLDLRGAPQRAAKQHVNGVNTDIIWTQDFVRLPHIDGSPYGGKCVAFYGLDSAIRGETEEGDRPDFAIIDDPETREVAFSPTEQHREIEEIIDGDIAGLAGPDTTVSRVVLTTIQNRKCFSYRVTDRSQKATFAGERYGWLAKWPGSHDESKEGHERSQIDGMWQEYIAIRQRDQKDGDKDGLNALAFYIANRELMERGSEVTNPNRFNKRVDANGVAVEISAVQAFFNRVADWGLPRVLAELQNDPEEEETDQTLGLTAGKVASRISGLDQHKLPMVEPIIITVGLDLGKFWSHWVKIAWFGNATGVIIDYGILETPGLQANTPEKAIEIALLKSLLQWRTDILADNPPAFCLVDSGDYSAAVYEFVRQVNGNPFAASKGSPKFFMGTASDTRRHFSECYASHQPEERLWLYNVNSEYWKNWVHERFSTPTFSDQQQFNDGTLSLFASPDAKKHLTFSHHIVAEERRELFVEGKGLVRKWVAVSKNNHWLDATALACCAAGVMGVRLIPRTSAIVPPAAKPAKPRLPQPANDRFRKREGGWIPKRKS